MRMEEQHSAKVVLYGDGYMILIAHKAKSAAPQHQHQHIHQHQHQQQQQQQQQQQPLYSHFINI